VLHKEAGARSAVRIEEACKDDVAIVGGKGANLGELVRAGIPVPPGFVVTSQAYFGLLEGGLSAKIEQRLAGLNVNDSAALNSVAAEIKRLICEATMPPEVAAEIASAYKELGEGPVAVRSSATAEDLAEASFAGQQESYLNIEGPAAVIRGVQDCWSSLFEPRAIFYRAGAGFAHVKVGIAVVVQKMVQSELSGVMFTLHPVTNDRTHVVIEAVYGLGEAIVSGMVTPDSYVVDKASGAILDCQVVPQEEELVRATSAASGEETNVWQPVDWSRRAKQKLSVEALVQLATLGAHVEQHFGCPQDIEWAFAGGSFYIVQARAVTTIG
jgi:pyruvate,water dikinase